MNPQAILQAALEKPVIMSASHPNSTPRFPVRTGSVVLCPGQGAQHVGMGQAWYEADPGARAIFDQADQVLGMPLSKLCFEGPEDQLNRTDVAQAAIYTCSVAAFTALKASGQIEQVAATAGLSLGEFTALHLAGAYDFATGLKLVRLRGQAMQQAAEAQPSSMVAVIGVDENQVVELCLKVLDSVEEDHRILVPANFNCPKQIVVSGTQVACDRALEVAEQMGVAAKALSVAGAFHSPIMQPAARQLAKALDQTQWHDPSVPVLSNVTGQPHDASNVESIKGLLVEQLTRPVRWEDNIRWLIEHLPADDQLSYDELAPGRALSGMMKKIDRKTKLRNFSQPTA